MAAWQTDWQFPSQVRPESMPTQRTLAIVAPRGGTNLPVHPEDPTLREMIEFFPEALGGAWLTGSRPGQAARYVEIRVHLEFSGEFFP